jgi:hypothetical protein
MPIRLPKETCQQWLAECKEDNAFISIDGHRIKSVKAMVKLFERMSEDTYNYHVGPNKNDFAAWVEGVFQNGHLAANFRSARSKREAYQYVKRHHLMLLRNLRDAKLREERKQVRRLS